MASEKKVNVKQLIEDMDRYLEFCHREGKRIQHISLTPEQHAAFMKKEGKPEWHGVPVVVQ